MDWLHPLDKKALRDGVRLWGQLLAASMVLASGLAVLVMSHYLHASLSATQSAYYERYRFADVFAHVRRAPLSLSERVEAIEGVERAEARIKELVRLELDDVLEPAAASIVSLPEDASRPALNDLIVSHGAWPTPDRPADVLVSTEFAATHALGPGDALTAVINGRKRELTIAGLARSPEYVYVIGPGELVPQHEKFGVLWMNRKGLERAFDMDGAFNDIAIALSQGANQEAVIADLDRLLDPYGGAGAYGRSSQVSHQFLQSEVDQTLAMGRVIPPIFLLTAAFMLHVAIGRLIDTERSQIGLLKAFGYGPASIAGHYLKLAMIPAALGAGLGIALGVWAGEAVSGVYTRFYNLPFMLRGSPGPVYAYAVLAALATCGSAALLSVRRALALEAAVAMRPPAPPVYRRSIVDRLRALEFLSAPARIILRNIMRTPWRSALTTLGVAGGCAILVAGTFMWDAMTFVTHQQFVATQRQDMTVSFPIEQPGRIMFSLERLPGVTAVEGVRGVAVRLSNGPKDDLTSLMGLPETPELYRPLDASGAPISPPPNGIMLSRLLAEKLALEPGDSVSVEVLEGRRPTLSLPITAFVEDYIGSAAYMRREELNRALKEGPMITMANLSLDMAERDAFYRAVKGTPVIATVTERQAMIDGVRETMTENVWISVVIFALFAATICFGVVYNAARISLSERGRELASLRVMGFTKGEASYVLLGELAVLVLLALPLGCLLGYLFASGMIAMFATELVRPPLYIPVSRYAWSILVTLAAALASGLIVRRRVNRLDLIGVLKTRE